MFSFDVVHCAGITHLDIDPLLRLPANGADTTPLKDGLPLLAIDTPGITDTAIYFVDMVSNAHNPLEAVHVPFDTPNGMVGIPAMPTAAESIRAQAKNTCCFAMTSQAGQPHALFYIDQHGLLVCRSTIDGTIQIVVPTPQRKRVLALAQNLLMAEHAGKR